jgi:hypothetical protein
MLLDWINSYFQLAPLGSSKSDQYSTPYHTLDQLQESIDGDHFLHGKISKHCWAILQQDYLQTDAITLSPHQLRSFNPSGFQTTTPTSHQLSPRPHFFLLVYLTKSILQNQRSSFGISNSSHSLSLMLPPPQLPSTQHLNLPLVGLPYGLWCTR